MKQYHDLLDHTSELEKDGNTVACDACGERIKRGILYHAEHMGICKGTLPEEKMDGGTPLLPVLGLRATAYFNQLLDTEAKKFI
jgi:hypothetical protein